MDRFAAWYFLSKERRTREEGDGGKDRAKEGIKGERGIEESENWSEKFDNRTLFNRHIIIIIHIFGGNIPCPTLQTNAQKTMQKTLPDSSLTKFSPI